MSAKTAIAQLASEHGWRRTPARNITAYVSADRRTMVRLEYAGIGIGWAERLRAAGPKWVLVERIDGSDSDKRFTVECWIDGGIGGARLIGRPKMGHKRSAGQIKKVHRRATLYRGPETSTVDYDDAQVSRAAVRELIAVDRARDVVVAPRRGVPTEERELIHKYTSERKTS